MSKTISDLILMVRPKHFGYNAETAENNSFQSSEGAEQTDLIKAKAIEEFDNMVKTLRSHDIDILVIEDTDEPIKPDCIFPNNWFTTHEDGKLVTFPMCAVSRRVERRPDIIQKLKADYGYDKDYGFEYLEEEKQFLEGTGSMILDRDNRIIYACLSPRTDIRVLEKFAILANYSKINFHAYDDSNELIYHTNVMMALGTDFVVICLDSITHEDEKQEVLDSFHRTGKNIIEISMDQMNQFAGNMLQVKSQLGEPVLVMSNTAYNSLTVQQIDRLKSHTKILQIPIPTIEKYGGGSVRCMMAEIFKPI